jgi:trehalose 6-phosphate phosphatase
VTNSKVDFAFDACVVALSRSPAGLFTDIDGTISHVAGTPSAATIADGAVEALGALADAIALVSVVTGRSADDARTLVENDRVLIVGNHGLERIGKSGRSVHSAAQAQVEQIAQALAIIEQEIASDPDSDGVLFENKGLSGSIHFRLSTDRDQSRARILQLASREAAKRGLRVTEGRLVIELRPATSVNKGTATVDLIAELGLKGGVYIGDDVTDIDAFLALKAFPIVDFVGTSVAVLSPESDPRLMEAADVTVDGVNECVELLQRLASHLGHPK